MERHFDASLRQLKEELVTMAGLVERAIDLAICALQNRDISKIQEVFEIEKRVNDAHIRVDSSCLKLLALQQPLANDLRLIVAIIKINTDLERMGDQAVNIAHNADGYLKSKSLKTLFDLPLMFPEVKFMVGEAIDSFVRNNQVLAHDVLKRDDRIDSLKRKIFRDVLDYLKLHPTEVEQGLTLILISRNLERLGDHATNIAEDVIFAISGEDIRHSSQVETMKDALR